MALEIHDIIFNALKQSEVPYFLTDKDAKIIFVNKAFEKNSGYSFSQIKGQSPSILKSGRHNADFYAKMWEEIKQGNVFKSRIINKNRSGNFYSVMLSIQPIAIDNKVEFFLAREESIDNLIKLEHQLIESQKMESLATMTGELSHNFNNLLTVIIGSMELVIDDLPGQSPAKKLAEELLKSSKEQANTIKQLMTFSRKQPAEFMAVDLNALLKDILPLVQSQVTARIKVSLSLDEKLKKVSADDTSIKQVILNLTSNAKDAILENGEIKINTYSVLCESEEEEPYHKGYYSVMEISDNGSGIDSSAIEHVFEPFFTTKKKGKGTGLGLSSVYGIIKNHNGYVYASNNEKKGASFRIYLPESK